MSAELVVTYSSLGTRDNDYYYKGEECHACVKDLIRALRSDNEYCNVRKALGKASVLHSDLIPILVYHHDDIPLRNDVIRLLVNLTQPPMLCFEDRKERKDSEFTKSYMEVVGYLQLYKEEFTDTSVMNVLGTVLAELCQKEWEDRDDDDIIIIERILLLIRNVLHITSDPIKEQRTDDDVSIHDQVILNLHKNGIDELLLFLGSNPNETEWCMHVLEILFLLLKEQSPRKLVECGQRPLEEKEKDERMIEEILLKESLKKSQSMSGARHSRFGGSYYVKPKLIGRTRIHHKPLASVNEFSYDSEKKPRRTPKPKKPAAPPPKPRRSTYSIRMVLKEFCVQVLDCCFNPMMKVVMDAIRRQRSMENDETYYLWAIRFFMEFSRLNEFRVDIVSETLQLSTLRDVIRLIGDYYEHVFIHRKDKAEALNWSQRLHYAVCAYKELLLHIKAMTQSRDPVIVESSKVILGNILYHGEYRDVFVMLLRNYKEPLESIVFLQDVILMTHVYIHLMDGYCRKTGNVMVQKKRKVKKKRKVAESVEYGEVLSEETKMSRWEEMSEQVTACVGEDTEVVPYMTNEEIPLEEEKLTVMGKIYGSLCHSDILQAVTLLRNAREVWRGEVFGGDEVTPEDEVQCLHDIFFSSSAATLANRLVDNENMEDEENEGEATVQTYELEFDLNKLTSMFTNNKIVSAYCLVLSSYSTNSDELNHAIVKMLYRVAVKHKMAAMLYQISVFKTMLSILQEPPVPRLKELQEFSRFIVNGFFSICKTNPVAFVELMFWKTSGECYELAEGYGTLARQREFARNKAFFTREQEEELAELFERYKDENDIVGCIVAALPPELCRTRKIIASQIVSQGLVDTRKALHKKATKNKVPWSEEDIYTLQSLWQPDRDVEEAIKELVHYFPGRGVANIKKQLYTLGLLSRRNKKQRSVPSTNDGEFDELNSSIDNQQQNMSETTVDQTDQNPVVQRHGSRGEIDPIVSRLIRKGYSSELAWLSEYLVNEAEDRELDSEWEDMCLAPQQENQSVALGTQLFKDLLVSIELAPPENQVYWRIPKTLTPQHLREVAQKLTPSHISDDAVLEEEEEDNSPPSPFAGAHQDTDDSDDDGLSRTEMLMKLQQKRRANKNRLGGPFNEENEEVNEAMRRHDDGSEAEVYKGQKRKKIVIEDTFETKRSKRHFSSDDESDVSNGGELVIDTSMRSASQTIADQQGISSATKSFHRRLLDDSSASDED